MKITTSILICAIVLLQSCCQIEPKRAIIHVTDDKGKPLEDCKAYIHLFIGGGIWDMVGVIPSLILTDYWSEIMHKQWEMLYPLEYVTNKDGMINALLPLYDRAEYGNLCYWIIVKDGYHTTITPKVYSGRTRSYGRRKCYSAIVGNFQIKMIPDYKEKPKESPRSVNIYRNRKNLNKYRLSKSVRDPHLHKIPKGEFYLPKDIPSESVSEKDVK